MYTYRGDLVLDPFIGSGTTAVAAVRTERHYVGFDTDEAYIATAEARIDEEWKRLARDAAPPRVIIPAIPSDEDTDDLGFQARAVREGKKARDLARLVLEACDFKDITANVKYTRLGVEVNFEARDQRGGGWRFDVSGAFTSSRPGLRRTDTLWKALGKAAVLAQADEVRPLVLLTTHVPVAGKCRREGSSCRHRPPTYPSTMWSKSSRPSILRASAHMPSRVGPKRDRATSLGAG